MKKWIIGLVASLLMLCAVGVEAASDRITFQWEQDMTVPIVGWKIYQRETSWPATIPVGTVPFQTLVWNGTTAPTYEGTTTIPVQAGTLKVFYWVLTAYNAQGESGRSNEVTTTHDFRLPIMPVTFRATVVRVP